MPIQGMHADVMWNVLYPCCFVFIEDALSQFHLFIDFFPQKKKSAKVCSFRFDLLCMLVSTISIKC